MAAFAALEAPMPRLVAVRKAGERVLAPWFWWRWNAVRESAFLPWMHFHDLRHVNATLLARAGVHPRVTQERLGHSNPAFSQRVYQHVDSAMQTEAAEALGRLLRNP